MAFLTDREEILDWLEDHLILPEMYDVDYSPSRDDIRNSKSIVIDSQGRISILENAEIQPEPQRAKLPVQFLEIDGDFKIDAYMLNTLKGCPKKINGRFTCTALIRTLEGGPEIVKGVYDVSRCKVLHNLNGLPKIVDGRVFLPWFDHLPLLRVFYLKNKAKSIDFINRSHPDETNRVWGIIDRYIGMGPSGMIPCAAELIKAGFKGNARL